ncbi:MAG: hypothetical protein KKF46_03830 [Nanoarchaeota archaeon]|nr:hypothetical protein [Nanoarchaeota archaeon]MBU1321464.1 hypothetical protein [Nanoarchaeota archaeon]MBU1597398.1 hypothetical protein [Nanoarchaeota archaeon]MBU2442365.1 hypothetical protein [Nanoarchaeota archaeon]
MTYNPKTHQALMYCLLTSEHFWNLPYKDMENVLDFLNSKNAKSTCKGVDEQIDKVNETINKIFDPATYYKKNK